MSRRANGEGSITKRKDGRWQAAVWVTTLDGGRKRVFTYARDRKAAQASLVQKLDEVRRGIPTSTTPLTVGEYLDEWVREHLPKTVRRTTAIDYEIVVRVHVKPRIGAKRLKELSIRNVQAAVDEMLQEGHSARVILKFRQILSSALSEAIRRELVSRNVALHIRLPQYKPKPIRPWTAQEATTFLAHARQHRWYVGYLLVLVYGLREGEAIGLRWCDIDFNNNEVHIRQQIQRFDGSLVPREVKTEAGNRILPLVPAVREALIELAEAQAIDFPHQYEEAPAHSLQGTIVRTSKDTSVEPGNFRRTFYALCDKAGLRRITIHHKRHTLATLLDFIGVSPKDAQAILGHAHISTTQQIYQHSNQERRREAVAAVTSTLMRHADLSSATADTRRSTPVRIETSRCQDGMSNLAAPSNPENGNRPPEEPVTAVNGNNFLGSTDRVRSCDLRLMSPGSPLPELQEHGQSSCQEVGDHTDHPCCLGLSMLSVSTIKSLQVRERRRLLGRVAVKNGCQTVPSPMPSAGSTKRLRAISQTLRSKQVDSLRRRSFPLNLIPDSTRPDHKEVTQ